ncbi:ABC transporter substrate-binding protein [Colwellia psychrerythraea]|uniref:Putative sulfonate ABC transporter, periplasmic sulfonate-binding protein n=1 Tax=Colwellia psychrerythraea (strain 34H / ATCC BAA-681) TaxID=167879 RepID=Q483V8_COLP3|nr:ABC transporter substrate-binding protein [Colwellia psychrerythraea]AAZ27514.1 putative sulfonate ABC transporter, periplasmic sulfonate-binding protein [Colwellia psychrerythraea 34H]
MSKWFIGLMVCFFLSSYVVAQPEVRVGVLKFGTVNWEIDVIKHHQLDKKFQFDLTVMALASKNASAVALQSKAVDIILSDWLWVNRQRFEQRMYTMYPTSMATGGLYVSANSAVKSLADLKGKKVGIAGGAVDKSWLLLQAYSQKKYGLDLKKQAEPTFAVPPLLNRLMLRGDLDAAINFWHYGARLKAAGYETLVTVPQMLAELGIETKIPLLGWVFDQTWANEHPEAITRFLQASLEAKQILLSSDKEWQRIRPLIKAENEDVFTLLKKDYRAGLLREFGDKEIAASQQVFEILAEQGGSTLVGKATALSEGTFWRNNTLDKTSRAKSIQ